MKLRDCYLDCMKHTLQFKQAPQFFANVSEAVLECLDYHGGAQNPRPRCRI